MRQRIRSGHVRHPTRALDEHGVAGIEAARGHECVPRGHGGARQTRRLFVREMFRDGDDSFRVKRYVRRRQSLHHSAQRALGFRLRRLAVEPLLHEDPGHALAHFHSRHAFADGDNLAHAIRKRRHWQAKVWIVGSLHNHQIAVVERPRAHLQEHLPGAWARLRPVGEGQ